MNEVKLSCLRQLAFEEPASRFARLKKTVLRQLPRGARSQNDYRSLGAIDQILLHGKIFSVASENRKLDYLVSFALALSDIASFSESAFELWFSTQSLNPEALLSAVGAIETAEVSLPLRKLVLSFAESLALSRTRLSWLCVSLLACPAWSVVSFEQSGELEQERLANLSRVIAFLKGETEPTAQSLLRASCLLKPALIALVEGQSEVILLPACARLSGIDLAAQSVLLVASGGARQVSRRYLTLRDSVKVPIVCVLDGDAVESIEIVEDSLRDQDGLFVFSKGELEDVFAHDVLVRLLESQMESVGHSFSQAAVSIPQEGSRKEALNRLFRESGLGNFDKVEFAAHAASELTLAELPSELKQVIDLFMTKASGLS